MKMHKGTPPCGTRCTRREVSSRPIESRITIYGRVTLDSTPSEVSSRPYPLVSPRVSPPPLPHEQTLTLSPFPTLSCLQVDLLSHLLAAGARFDYTLFQETVAEWDSSQGLREDALAGCIGSMLQAGSGGQGLQRLSLRGKFLIELAILKPAPKVTASTPVGSTGEGPMARLGAFPVSDLDPFRVFMRIISICD